jgi:3',5'-cyclic AMP phosphodiesterase CpdA
MNLRFFFFSFLAFSLVSNSAHTQDTKAYKEPKFDSDWSNPTLHPDRIILNISEDPARNANISWRTSQKIETGVIEYAEASADPRFVINAFRLAAKSSPFFSPDVESQKVKATYHSISLQNLKPATTYAYRVGDSERWSEWLQFTTASVDLEKKFSFLYVGDAQNYILELWSRLIRQSFKTAPDAKFIIHAGDLVNNAHRDKQWHEWFTAGGFIHSMIPSMPTPGNHEYQSKSPSEQAANYRSLSAQWQPQFNLPENGPKGLEETTYFVDYQGARIISLNSNIALETQAEWLDSLLSKTTKKWIILTFHHPMYSASSGRDNPKIRAAWKPILDKYQVDLVLQGHDHSYARGRVSPGENLLDGVNLRDQTGTVYVVSVSGGKMYEVGGNWDEFGAQKDRSGENTQLFQVISIAGDHLLFESYTAIGELYDSFELIKSPDGPNKFIELRAKAIPEKISGKK